MGNRRWLPSGLAVLVVVLLALLPACRKRSQEPKRIPPPVTGQVRGDLRIVHVSPEGQTSAPSEAEEILVVFDRPMAPLAPLPLTEETAFLRFEPSLTGKFRWMGSRTVSFTPRERLPFGTEFKVTVPAGIRSLDGYALKEGRAWSFETMRPRLVRSLPINNAKQQTLSTDILLVFNQAVNERSARPFIRMTAVGAPAGDRAVGFTIGRPPAGRLKDAEIDVPAERVLQLRPESSLDPGVLYAVDVMAGLPGVEGPLGMERHETLRFRTYEVFAFKGLAHEGVIDPSEPLHFAFTNRVIYKELVGRIRFDPRVEVPDYYQSWDHGNADLYLSLPLAPETKYAVTIEAGLKDAFGNALGRDHTAEFVTAAYPPSVRMTAGNGVLESTGGLLYPLSTMNTKEVRLMAVPLRRDTVIPVLENPRIFDTSKLFIPDQGFATDRPLPLPAMKNVWTPVPLDIGGLLGSRNGFLLLQLDTTSRVEWNRYPKAFLQATNLGLTGKFSPENNIVWVTELQTGLPVPDADVEIRNEENAVRWKGRTDADGRAESPGWRSLGIRSRERWSKPKQWVIASRGTDAAVLSSEWGTGLEPYRFDIPYDWSPEPETIRGELFTERGIYRAGESVHVKGVLRKNDHGRWSVPASSTSVDWEVHDPFGKSIRKSSSRLDGFGSFAFDLETREDAALGTYGVTGTIPSGIPGGEETRIHGSFRVEAFRPAEFEVHLKTLKDQYVFGEAYKAELRGTYLFGGAMSGQMARWSLRLNPTSFAPPGWKDYRFGGHGEFWEEDEDLSERSRLLSSGQGTLGPDGRLAVEAGLMPLKEKSTVSATLEATVQGPSRRAISNRIDTIVHQGSFYIGLKPSSSFVGKGETLATAVIAASPDGDAVAGQSLTLKLVKREWKSVRRAGIGGRFEWHSEKSDTEIDARPVRTEAEPVEVAFKPETSGMYVLLASGRDGRNNEVTSSAYVYVTGKDYVPWERRDDDALELVASSDAYRPGETARILVKSPYEKAKALVTIEREFVLESTVREIQGSASEIEIPITTEHIPNVFVSVLLVQGRTAAPNRNDQDVGKPAFKMGYVGLSVDPSEKRLNVDVKADRPKYGPRDKVSLRVSVRDAGERPARASITLAVVDLGVLNLIGYRTPDLYSVFYGEKPLSVQTSESRLHVVGQRSYGEKGENPGGGGSAAAFAPRGLSEVEMRGDFKSTVYWNASLLTDEQGEAAVEFSLPDNLTTFRVAACAQTRESLFGKGETDLPVSKPLLLLPSAPRFARAGDAFKGGVVLHNNTDRSALVDIALDARGITASGTDMTRAVKLAAGESAEVLFDLAAEKPGEAILAFRASSGPDSDGLEVRFPILIPRPTESVATYDSVEDAAKEERIRLPRDVIPDQSRLVLHASASALSGLSGSVDYLSDYPYSCLEQRLSAILPHLVASRIIRDFKMSSLATADVRSLVARTLREAYACQKESGGFGLWPDSPFESPFVSCYAVFALLQAKASGHAVDADRLERSLVYLRNLLLARPEAGFPLSVRCRTTTRAYALYLLALAGRPEPAYNEKAFAERSTLSLLGRAYLLKALHLAGQVEARSVVLRELLNLVKSTPGQAHFEEGDGDDLRWICSSNVRTTAVVLQALIEVGSDDPLLPGAAKWLVAERRNGRWASTQENFFVFYALNEFYGAREKDVPDFQAAFALDGKTVLKETFRAVSHTASGSVSLDGFGGKEAPLRITKDGRGTLYYGARLTYAPREPLEPRDEGFALYKRIETTDGKPLGEVKAGSLVAVTIELVVPKESLFPVVDDPLPAGFEAVNAALRTESEESQRELEALGSSDRAVGWRGFNHIEMRDDRVLLFADSLAPGIHRFRYLARALTAGTFTLPGTKAEEMYAPEVFGRSGERTVKIVK